MDNLDEYSSRVPRKEALIILLVFDSLNPFLLNKVNLWLNVHV